MGDFTEIIPFLWMGGQQIPTQPGGFDAICNCKELNDWALIGVPCLHVPMIDGPMLPDQWILSESLKFVASAVWSGKKTLVHCAEGHNRSGLVVARYLILCKAFSATDAINLIKSKRPGALTNQTFVDYLLALE